MSRPSFTNPQQTCEDILLKQRRYNLEHNILPSENAVIDRLLARAVELKRVYEELHGKLEAHPPALEVFLGLVLSTAAFWSPAAIAEMRAARDELDQLGERIAAQAIGLADLIERRSSLHDASGFTSGTHTDVCGLLEAAGKHHSRFRSYVRSPLKALRAQFDLKYWPSLIDFLQALAADASETRPQATDPVTAVATAASRPSKADFFKALLAAMEENGPHNGGQLPKDFNLSDSTLAALTNCALDLAPEESTDAPYVKRFRQRERSGA
jgi:hypothetical protein